MSQVVGDEERSDAWVHTSNEGTCGMRPEGYFGQGRYEGRGGKGGNPHGGRKLL